MAKSKARSLLDDIELLCASGAGLSAVVGPMCGLVRTYADVESVAFFWLDEQGRPLGFYHDCAPAEMKDLFITRFDELFSGPDQVNMIVLARGDGPSIGRFLEPGEQDRFWRSNIQRYLCDPLGHRYSFDIRIEAHGIGRAVCCMWRGEGRPFERGDVEHARPLQRAWRHLFERERADARWVAVEGGTGEMMTDAAGGRLLAIDPAADRMLMNSHLLDQRVSMTQAPEVPPAFVGLLARDIAALGEAEMILAVPAGRIVARARPARTPGEGDAMLLISLMLQAAHDVLCIQHLLPRPLTAMQRRVALFGMQGGDRTNCIATLGTTAEAMKKHCAVVFSALGLTKWNDLALLGEQLAAPPAR